MTGRDTEKPESVFLPRDFSKTQAKAQKKAQRLPLTTTERSSPYAKYYDVPVAAPDPGHREKMDQPMDPSKAFMPEDIDRLLDIEWLEGPDSVEVGWCNLPNGAGYIANRIFHPGWTPEMVDWWFVWHALEDVRYRLWYPLQHGGISVSSDDRARILDESIPMRDRNYGVTHFVVEDTNTGMAQIDIRWRTPAQMGFTQAKFDKTVVASAMGMGWASPVEDMPDAVPAPSIMCHVFYPANGGLVHRTRFWPGYRYNAAGKPEYVLPQGMKVPQFAIKGLAQHAVDEFTRLRAILPDLHKEFGGTLL